MVNMVAEIVELVGRLASISHLSTNPMLRRTNRIHKIYGSLAIEQNALSLAQVTAVLNGKHVLALPKDIAEVKNAYQIYKRLEELDSYDVKDLLEWTKNSEVHMLILSCVLHYELEQIHPFVDGNGRIGRLWHTLLLSKWNPAFAWLPVESMIHANQRAYYVAINASNAAGNSTAFIEFMLSIIKASLIDAINMRDALSDGTMDKAMIRRLQVEKFFETKEFIMNTDVRTLCNVSATANRILAGFAAEGKLTKCRIGGHWAYKQIFIK